MQSYNKILKSLILNICIYFIFNNYRYIHIYMYRISYYIVNPVMDYLQITLQDNIF